jgi:deoxyribodipyrimidine photo-lyase
MKSAASAVLRHGPAMSLSSSGVAKAKHGVVWFKDTDLRTSDHRALATAHTSCDIVDHVYCFDPRNFKPSVETGLERVDFRRLRFLVESVADLKERLTVQGSHLRVFIGKPEDIIPIVCTSDTKTVYCNEEVASEELRVMSEVSKRVTANGVSVLPFWTGYLVDKVELPLPLAKLEIFTSFRKTVEGANVIDRPCINTPEFKSSTSRELVGEENDTLDTFSIYEKIMRSLDLPASYDLTSVQADVRGVLPFVGGETAALARLEHYCTIGIVDHYKQTRNGMVGADYSTKFSPWLALGCLSARTVYHRIKKFEKDTGIANEDTYWVIFELLWRDYMRFYGLKHRNNLFKLYGTQGISAKNKYPWKKDMSLFHAWATGTTGYPFIDANMRELLLTGWMSNRGRQNVASFLVRDMGLDWRLGAMHFERYLLDYDTCSNYGNWQYAAGVGSDPREDRYFNIVKQASSYDPDGDFMRLWCPELARLPTALLTDPRRLTPQLRDQHGISVEILPEPVVDLLHGDFKVKSGGQSSKDYDRRSRHGQVPGAKPRRY